MASSGLADLGPEIDALIREIDERAWPRLDADGVPAVQRLVEPALRRHGAFLRRDVDTQALARDLREIADTLPPRRTSRS